MNRATTAIRSYPLVGTTLLVALATLGVWMLGHGVAAQIVASLYVGAVVAWTVVGMVKDMLHGNFGLDILAVMAMVATLAVGEYGASLVIVLMLTGGEALEDYANTRAASALTALLEQTPQTAHLLASSQNSDDEDIRDIPADQVQVGDDLLVRPGEVVPVDVALISSRATIDQSAITGEPLPVDVVAGGDIPSGAINGDEAIRVRARHTTEDSQYQQIVALVSEAEAHKAPVVRIADRYAMPFTALSLAIAAAAWAVSGDPTRFAEVLVLATPCPLLIAAPVAFMGGLSQSAKNGVILKGGAVLESLARIKSAAFDKTGTITGGRPVVVRTLPRPGHSEDEVLRLAASAEQYSGHVLAAGIVAAGRERGLALTAASSADEAAGSGVTATLDGRRVTVGSAAFVGEAEVSSARTVLHPGEVATYVAVDDRMIGTIVLADRMRHDAPAVVAYLRAQGVQEIAMLTGDSRGTADVIASQCGITDVRSRLLPQAKVQLVGDLQPRPTLMVGDGVNDAPALAAADVGMAMGARGATAAGEAASAVIVSDSLWKVAETQSIARHTLSVALTAIWIGIVLSVGLMVIAATGAIPAMAGALTQEFVDLAAILYALRALGGRLPKIGDYMPGGSRERGIVRRAEAH